MDELIAPKATFSSIHKIDEKVGLATSSDAQIAAQLEIREIFPCQINYFNTSFYFKAPSSIILSKADSRQRHTGIKFTQV
ncbi:MAG: hypothetical protein A3G33_00125 [Omnitrophica bacterium RIFCSPLOWO2_12_FULL_44_17]|uniref:Uncharacterized protein n=1 Tax=Candidatus Danuiimicrobium aquiferis TaxID=1801832 RepID=A0A1G1L0W2_9BACT|nr:MAG: hypothetical protein A3E74_00310 [Omnitrophica bacterium RIFCSPHIGHO2_12_FULL_44_12]OGW98768.1 MAG: hypothetical protein A3G33_00125 [Omnitrophica bacterium RIFCSPLOWO2_12_FULL_44_17]OGX03772.1 MAG: hypothetical protein A3J12_00110 [Omnitrophica bacterium RIFCSPLOWO2_02_FULL_44_11]